MFPRFLLTIQIFTLIIRGRQYIWNPEMNKKSNLTWEYFRAWKNPAFLLKILSSYRFLNMIPLWLWQKPNRTFFVLTSLPVTLPVKSSGLLARYQFEITVLKISGENWWEYQWGSWMWNKTYTKTASWKTDGHAVPRAIETRMKKMTATMCTVYWIFHIPLDPCMVHLPTSWILW